VKTIKSIYFTKIKEMISNRKKEKRKQFRIKSEDMHTKKMLLTTGLSALFVAFTSMKGMTNADASTDWQMGFQDPATPVMEAIINFHNDLMIVVVGVGVFVGYIMWVTVQNFNQAANPISNRIQHGTKLEIIWTLTPAFILMCVAVPSFALLYSVDEIIDPEMTIKAVGHQWYWSYEYSDHCNEDGEFINFDSYMIPSEDLSGDSVVKGGHLRLLEVDNRVVLPTETHIRVVITSADVLHCWAIPSLGVKLDACPGRLNQTSVYIKRPGVFYGQCSEICGVNHGFMPIVVNAVSREAYADWINLKLENA